MLFKPYCSRSTLFSHGILGVGFSILVSKLACFFSFALSRFRRCLSFYFSYASFSISSTERPCSRALISQLFLLKQIFCRCRHCTNIQIIWICKNMSYSCFIPTFYVCFCMRKSYAKTISSPSDVIEMNMHSIFGPTH